MHPMLSERRVLAVLFAVVLVTVLFSTIHLQRSPQVFNWKVRDVLGVLQERNNSTRTFTNGTVEILDFDREHIKVIQPEVIDELYAQTDLDTVDWSKLAYVFYATSASHLCNAMMKVAELNNFGSRAQLVMLVNEDLLNVERAPEEYKILEQFSKDYKVVLKATGVLQVGDVNAYWLSSFTKLLVFNETDYDRVIYMDSDALLPRTHLDELFFLPPCKLAVPMGYWLVQAKLLKQDLGVKYQADMFDYVPQTGSQRMNRLQRFINDEITPFVDPQTSSLFNDQINKRNMYTNLYNSLPNYHSIDEFSLTNIVMVIQPSEELHQRVQRAIANRKPNEFDMDLVHYHMFPLRGVLQSQIEHSEEHSKLTFDQRMQEVPELLIIPHQVYGTLTSELNKKAIHDGYMAEAQDQAFALQMLSTATGEPAYYSIHEKQTPGDVIYNMTKYLHFSDSPIPKPWFAQDPHARYMSERIRCPSHGDFANDDVVKPAMATADCSAGENWEEAHRLFASRRMEVCGLPLIVTDGDTYKGEIN